MTNDMTPDMADKLHEQTRKGREAEMIFTSELWQEMDAGVKQWALSQTIAFAEDPARLQEVAMFLKAHEKYLEFLRAVKDEGMVAKSLLDAIIDET